MYKIMIIGKEKEAEINDLMFGTRIVGKHWIEKSWKWQFSVSFVSYTDTEFLWKPDKTLN